MKQIWHITTPALIPLTAVERVPLQSISEGSSITSYKGFDYGFHEDSHISQSRVPVLLPFQSDNRFHFLRKPIDRTLHLQQLIRLPGFGAERSGQRASNGTGAALNVDGPQQPHGLKMRYRPFGDAEFQSEGSDCMGAAENNLPLPRFELPSALDHIKRGEKRKAPRIGDDHLASRELVNKKRKRDDPHLAKVTQQTSKTNTGKLPHHSPQPVQQENVNVNVNGIEYPESQTPKTTDIPSSSPTGENLREKGHKKRKKDKKVKKVASKD